MTRTLRFWPSMLVVGFAVLVPTGCGQSQREEAPAAPRPPVSVRVAPATIVERAEPIEAGGVVAAAETAVLASRVVAPVTMVAVRAGDRIRRGDVLIRLDAADLAARVQEAGAAAKAAGEALAVTRSAQAAAAAEHKLAAAWHTRIAQLRERNSATPQELDEAVARLTAASARMTAALASVEQADAHFAAMRAGTTAATITESYAVIRAPFDGEITERFTDPGNLATPGQPLLRVDAAGRRRVDVRVDEARLGYVHVGDTVAVQLDDQSAASAEPLEGTVVEVARAIAVDQRAFTVKVALPPHAAPRTGAFARVRFAGARRRALIVPASALRSQGQLTSLFIVSDGVAHLRLVQVGASARGGTELLAGVDEAEQVVISPPATLTDGRRVQIAAPQAGASP
jgi:RND family efflux transporter MFP subunit